MGVKAIDPSHPASTVLQWYVQDTREGLLHKRRANKLVYFLKKRLTGRLEVLVSLRRAPPKRFCTRKLQKRGQGSLHNFLSKRDETAEVGTPKFQSRAPPIFRSNCKGACEE